MVSINKLPSPKFCAMIVFLLLHCNFFGTFEAIFRFGPIFLKNTFTAFHFGRYQLLVFYHQKNTEVSLVAFGSPQAILLGRNCQKLLARMIYFKYQTGFFFQNNWMYFWHRGLKQLFSKIRAKINCTVLGNVSYIGNTEVWNSLRVQRFRVFLKKRQGVLQKQWLDFVHQVSINICLLV